MELFDRATTLQREGRLFAMVTVVRTKGSTPRAAGARMIVFQDGTIEGSIGGGALEKKVIEEARDLFGRAHTTIKEFDLTNELGMCCGGKVEIFFEVFGPTDQLFIFGAGHVAKPLAALAKTVQFQVTVIDERSDFLTIDRFPTADRRLLLPVEDALAQLTFGKNACLVVCTHDHQLDQRIIEANLERPFRYLGVIGSHVKSTKTRARLKAAGFNDDAIARLRSPIGLNLGSQTPEEIAVSIVSELIAARYSSPAPYTWLPPPNIY